MYFPLGYSFLNHFNQREKMKKIISSLIVLGLSVAPSIVSASGLYVSGHAGISSTSDFDYGNNKGNFDLSNATATDGTIFPANTLLNVASFTTKLKSGFTYFGAIGYDFNNFRIEGEIGHQTINIDKFEGSGNVTVNGTVVDTGGTLNVTIPAKGDYSLLSFFANAYYDIPVGSTIKPYVTAGIGIAKVKANDITVSSVTANNASNTGKTVVFQTAPSPSTTDESVLAYQIGVGVAIPVSKNIDIDARYRYTGTGEVAVGDITTPKKSLTSNSFLLGLSVGI